MKQKKSTIILFFSSLLCALLLKLFVIDILYVSGSSMSPTIKPQSFVVVFKMKWGIPKPFSNSYIVRWSKPEQNDVVIYPWLGKLVIKRCLAIDGDELFFMQKNGYSVIVHNKTIPLTKEQFDSLNNFKTVPIGMIFAIGDNMFESKDSRDYGFISIDSIRGTILWK